MKKIIISILCILAVCFMQTKAFAQSSSDDYSGLISKKTAVRNPDNPFSFTINFESYVIGTESHGIAAIDVALVLDMSQSMAEPSAPGMSDYSYYGTGKYSFQDLTGYEDISLWHQGTGCLDIDNISLPVSGSSTVSGTGYVTDYACINGSGTLCYIMAMRENSVTYLFYYDVSTGTATLLGKNSSTRNVKFDSEVAIYHTESSPKQKRDLLKDAAKSFADIVSESAKSQGVNHRISAVRYGDNSYYTSDTDISENASYSPGASVVKQFTAMNETGTSNLNAIKTALGNMATGGQTYPQNGIKLAEALFNQQGSTNQKVVVFMTDGEPGSGSFNGSVATNTVSEILNLKQAGAKIYTVGVFNSFTNKNDTYNYMNAVSSNYPTAASYSVGDTEAHDYFRVVGEKSLSDIFSDIAQEVVSGGPAIDVNSSNSYVMDFVETGFHMPEGSSAETAVIKAYKCIGYDEEKDLYSFETTGVDPKTLRNSAGTTIIQNPSDRSFKVTGFDYASNYVRVIKRSGQPDTYDGYKLTASFPIDIDMDNAGGINIPTNSTASGLYYDEDGDGTYEQVNYFDVPYIKIPNLVVVKGGMKTGESALFKVECVDEGTTFKPLTLVLSPDTGETVAKAEIKFVPVGRYRVTELDWSWAYDLSSMGSSITKDDASVTEEQWNEAGYGDRTDGYLYPIPTTQGTATTTNSITRNVNDFTGESTYNGTLFDFTNTAKSSTPAHGEDREVNSFSSKGLKGTITVSDPTNSIHKLYF